MKQNVVKLLDALEDNLKQSSSALMKNVNLRHLEEIEDLKHMLQQLNVMDFLIKSYLTSATSDQVFVCIEGLKRICQDSEKRIMEKEKNVTRKEVFLKINDMLSSVLHIGPNDTTQLATIEEKESAVNLAKFRSVFDKKHYKIKKVHSRNILARGSNIAPTYNDLLYLQNNDLLLIDSFHGYCCLINGHCIERASGVFVTGIYQKETGFYRKLQYAAFLENNKIAVSICHEKKICFTSSNDLGVVGTIDCKYKPKCMVGLDNNAVAISWEDPVAFGIIEIQNNTYSDKIYVTFDNSGRQLKSFDHMAIGKDLRHVIQPCNVDKAVYCFSFSGVPVFTYKTEKLKEPSGVAVDNDSNVYICDQEGAGIHIVSPSGVAIKVIKDGCPEKPLAISFSLKGDTFAVSEYENSWDKIHFFALVPDH